MPSSSRDILRRFIDANERQLFALTATDAVAGELDNSVLAVDSPEQLFDIRRIVVEADTTAGTIAHAGRLDSLIERFFNEEDGWFNDALIDEMVETAKLTGDITRNPVRLQHAEFEQKNFWTAHFGGIYLFQDVKHSALIASTRKPKAKLPINTTLDFGDRKEIARFLRNNQLAEPIVKHHGADEVAILRQKMDFIIAGALANEGVELANLSRSDMRRLAARHADNLPKEYAGLAAMVRWAETRGARPRIGLEHPSYFYLLRATPRQGTGKHALGRAVSSRRASAVHLPQGSILPSLPRLARCQERLRSGLSGTGIRHGQGRRPRRPVRCRARHERRRPRRGGRRDTG